MKATGRFLITGTLAITAGCSSPSVSRSTDGLLILDGEYPKTFNAFLGRGILQAEGRCLVLTMKGVGVFQPVFRKGATRDELERQLGSLIVPRDVSVGGPDEYSADINKVATSKAVKECRGKPIVMSGFGLWANEASPPPPTDIGQPPLSQPKSQISTKAVLKQ